MKKIFLKTIAVALSILTFTSTLPVSALYRGVMGEVYYVKSAQIGAGVDYTEYRSVTDGLNERAYVFEYRAGEGSFPIVAYGDKLTGSVKVNNLAKDEVQKGNNVIGGVNGDFFSIQTGIPMGTAIRDGRLLTDDDNNSAVGFTYDGETVFGNPEITFTVSHTYKKTDDITEEENKNESSTELTVIRSDKENNDTENDITDDELETDIDSKAITDAAEEDSENAAEAETVVELIDGVEYITEVLPVSYFNKYPTEWGAYLLDDMFSDSTNSKKNSLELVIKLDDKEAFAKIGETLTGEIVEINVESTDTKLNKGELVISVCETSSYRSAFKNVAIGNKIAVSFNAADGWENVESAIGGSDVFIKDGIIDESVINDSHEKIANPRTAVGVRPDGTVVIFAADGRQNISYGFRMISLAKTLLSFGCIYAINLDGGGSTTAVVKLPEEDETRVVNSPSDGSARSVSNALLLIDNTEPDNIPRYIIPENASPIILSGESYTFDNVKFCDSSLTEVIFSENDEKNQSIIDRLKENLEIKFDKSRLYYYRDFEMPDLGTISDDGKTFTASGECGEIPLLLTSEYGDFTVSGRALLFVANSPDEIIAKLESNIFTSTDGFDITFDSYYMGSRVPSSVNQVEYSLTDDIVVTPYTGEVGKNSLADCSIGYIDVAGKFIPYPNADGSAMLTLSFNGKKIASARVITGLGLLPIIDETEFFYDFPVVAKENIKSGNSPENSDITEPDKQINPIEKNEDIKSSVSEHSEYDTENMTPKETMTVHTTDISINREFDLNNVRSLDLYASSSELLMYAFVSSGKEEIKIKYELQNEPVNGEYYHYRASLDGVDGSLRSVLNISAEENSGKNGSLKIQRICAAFNDTETIFADTYGHWAKSYINSLYRMEIVGGEEHNGEYIFSPERSLSRAEFAVMISRALNLEVDSDYTATEFDDLSEIPSWALPHIKAVSAHKLMNGKRMADGSLKFDSSGKITRQEIMQVIGNILKAEENGNDAALSDNSLFEDSSETDGILIEETSSTVPDIADLSSVAEWAYDNVLLTLESKIITGYSDKTIRPLNNVTRAEAATIILRTVSTLDLQK